MVRRGARPTPAMSASGSLRSCRRPGSGSTPHDNRRASRRATPIVFVSNHASEHERDVLATSADSLQLPRPHPPLALAPEKTRRVRFRRQHRLYPAPAPYGRSVRDLQIPIARAQPTRASSSPRFPPYEAFGRGPRAQPRRACKGPACETLQSTRHPMSISRTVAHAPRPSFEAGQGSGNARSPIAEGRSGADELQANGGPGTRPSFKRPPSRARFVGPPAAAVRRRAEKRGAYDRDRQNPFAGR
jgi:hypothetical protein